MSKFTEMLTSTRNNQNMTKADVARKMGWSPMYYGRYENGYLTPKGANLEKFAAFLGISSSELTVILNENKESEKVA